MTIKVTVIVPAYNTSSGILMGLNALRRQTLPRDEYEVIYVDDGSTDDTGAILDRECAAEPNFTVIHAEHSGWPGRPRNIGLTHARGEYVFFADDDDWMERDALQALHERAVADDADIVVGRIAGHGRSDAPREIFQKSITGGDIRRDHVLMTTTTVHKLYRLAFLRAHDLRFPEGRVRLEDHMFALNAYLRTTSVSVLHDRTVYHLVRNRDFGNISFSRIDPYGYAESIAAIMGIIAENVEPGPVRDKLVDSWYRRKVLLRLGGKQFVTASDGFARDYVAAFQPVVDRTVPIALDARLPATMRLQAALLRAGNAEALQRLGRYDRAIKHRTSIDRCRWVDGKLIVEVNAEMTTGDSEALAFVRNDGRAYREIPAEVIGSVSGELAATLRQALDVSTDLPKTRIRALIRKRQPVGDIFIPATFQVKQTPVGRSGGPDRFSVRYAAELIIDPLTADHGKPLTGTWDVYTFIELCGLRTTSRVGVDASARKSVEAELTPAFVGPPTLLASPYLTEAHANLSLRLAADDLRPLRTAARPARHATVVQEGTHQRLAIPLKLGAAPATPIPVSLVLTPANGAAPAHAPAEIAASADGHTVLRADVPDSIGKGCRRWTIGVAHNHSSLAPLRLDLVRRGEGRQGWHVTTSWQQAGHEIRQNLRRDATKFARRSARRVPILRRLARTIRKSL